MPERDDPDFESDRDAPDRAGATAEAATRDEDTANGAGSAPHVRRRAVFALEGRAAPGLYVAGWALTLVGLIVVGLILFGSPPRSLGSYAVALAAIASLALGLLAASGAQTLQRRADCRRGYAGASPWLVLGALFAALLFVQVVLQDLLSLAGVDVNAPAGVLLVLIAYLPLYAGIVHLVVVAPGALSWAEIRRPSVFAPARPEIAPELGPYADGRSERRGDIVGDVAWGVALLAITIPATILALSIAIAIFGQPQIVPPLPETGSSAGRVLNLVSAALIAPIGEEIFYRGFVTNAWARSMPLRRAIVQAGLLFAVVHILGQPDARAAAVAFLGRVPVSLALGWIYLRRGSLYGSIAHHAGYNAFITLVAWGAAAG